jgi:adapter protein MecA 1/2
MRIERINDNKLRVFISFDDLEDRDIDLESFNYNTPETQELFWDLMEQAEVELGFDSMESQLCVEAVTDVDHGFIITITRMDDDGEMESIQKFIRNRSKRKEPVIRKKTAESASTVTIYCFGDLEAATGACRRVSPLQAGSGSSVWSCENNYYLVLAGMENPAGNQRRFEDIMTEYGDRVSNTSFFEGYLNEYGVCMIPANALERLAGFAPG